MPKLCKDVDCPERIDCCTTVRWQIREEEYYDEVFREWWLIHEGARIYKENGVFYIQWPMRCKNASEDGLKCLDYANRPLNCKLYTCRRMNEPSENEKGDDK